MPEVDPERMEPVVITGIGLVSSLGHDLAQVSARLREGRGGLVVDPERVERGFRSPLTGALPSFDPAAWLKRKERRAMDEPALYAAVAALRALDHAGLDRGDVAGPDTGVIIGNDSTISAAWQAVDQAVSEGTTRGLGSAAVVKSMNSTPSMNLSVLLGTQGACWSVSAACASGAHALGQAWGLLATGQQQLMLCGGTQELHWSAMAAFDGLGAFSTRDDDPAGAVRPFSVDRDGLVPGGGAAVLVLERLDHARRRGARPLARLLSYAFSSDGHHITAPSGAGAARCIRTALDLAGRSASEVEYINAHAAGTPSGDAAEGAAILEVFGPDGPPVSSTKALTGHECWMAGASELAYSLLMAEGGFLAPNCNFTAADPGLEALDIIRAPRQQQARLLLSNSFGFGGTNACILVQAGLDDA